MPPIGGLLIHSDGGCLGFQAYQGLLPGVGVEPSTAFRTLIDVSSWEVAKESTIDDTRHTGSFGAAGISVTSIAWRCAAEMLWDLYAPPNFLAAGGDLESFTNDFDVGYQFWAYVGSGANYPTSLGRGYYFSPSAKARMVTTVVDSAGAKRVRARIDVLGNSPLFALGSTPNDLNLYNDYIVHCRTRGWVW